jgi:hypothetical protein
VAGQAPDADLAAWLRFLLREVLDPRAREPKERAERLGLPGGHRVEGRVLLDDVRRPQLLVAAGRRVRVIELDEDLFPVEPGPQRGGGEVVDLAGHIDTARRGHSTER